MLILDSSQSDILTWYGEWYLIEVHADVRPFAKLSDRYVSGVWKDNLRWLRLVRIA